MGELPSWRSWLRLALTRRPRFEPTLARMHARPISEFVVHTPLRFVVRAKLTEDDGAPLGHGRAGQFVYELYRQLTADERAPDVRRGLVSRPATTPSRTFRSAPSPGLVEGHAALLR